MKRENDNPKTFATSAVTTDMPSTKSGEEEPYVEKNALVASGLGLVKVMGIDKRYVGLPPAVDEFNPAEEGDLRLTSSNTTFIPLWEVPFDPSIQIKDPTTGEFYFPGETATSWESCELNGVDLVPALPDSPDGGDGGDGGGGTPVAPSERSFAGSGTLDLTVDALKDTSSVTQVTMEDASAVPSYTVPNVTTLNSSDGTTMWPTGVNVLVTANWADDPVADDASARGGKRGGKQGDGGFVKAGTSGAEGRGDSLERGVSPSQGDKEKADKEKADKEKEKAKADKEKADKEKEKAKK